MTADAGQAVADRLHRIAERAGPADDGHTAARAVALDRHRRRRAGSWATGALAVVLLGTGASLAHSAVTEPPAATATSTPAPVTSTYVAPQSELVEAPVRGSLADDEDFLAAMAAAPWTGPVGPDGDVVDWGGPEPEPGTGRVVYAADVPGGHRWAVVVARAGTEWVWTWFTGPRGAEPAEMTPVIGGVPLWTGPLALMDGSAETSTLVVLGEPGLEAEYSPSLDRTSGGELVRDFDPLPLVDGVPLGVVISPVTWTAGEVQVTSPVGQQSLSPMLSGPLPSWPTFPTGPVDEALVAPCLEQLGLDVQTGSGLSWEAPEQLSSAEEAAREQEIAACFRAGER
ncbi:MULTISPECIES: hypothetical protein [unclassified Modestobacter]|uniref:hypothetical protein n=1 Tax=unclassified Modestobacter TaxID=2643866 RepID=UPI0022AA3916|nr:MULTISPECIES: hypothetical protein [unclassified Modestobacter]MCZ2814072.1 hypothetical protein [Modestobacter sp. VKM Ac-2979]MCZ2844512.1 hypothetical protein [Modestobacter sp. VKM Ac-2980]MCZ2848902.1 hypothetical protein [Modestobacter sp. VKM Ac-2978]